ncbi:MAG: carbonic anhydrase [Thermoleophilaceae bacterium]|nr:carbonic anhydrase [Thermoleophilaceae bacterium]
MNPPIKDLLLHADEFAEGRAQQELPAEPRRKLAIVTCMDARVDVHDLLGLGEGDAHVLRNAGGVVTADTVRSLTLSQRLLGTQSIMLIHHTNCGLEGLDEEALRDQLHRETGELPGWPIGSFTSVSDSVKASVAALRGDPFLEHRDDIHGFVYDVESGVLVEVV